MHPHITACVPGAILLAGLACVSCSDVTPADATAPSSIREIALSVQPEKVEPEFLPPIGRCTGTRAFRTRFVVVAGGAQGFVVQELHVSFSDRFGVLTVPTVLPASAAQSGSMIPSSPPVPLPTSMPIPIPSAGPNNGLSVFPGGSQAGAGDAGVQVSRASAGDNRGGRLDSRRSSNNGDSSPHR